MCSCVTASQEKSARFWSAAAFSFIELLVVVAIMAILMAMYWKFAGGDSRRTERFNCAKNLQRDLVAMEIYANDHASRFPDVATARNSAEALDLLLPRYTVDSTAFVCPASGDSAPPSGASIAKHKISYAYYMGWKKEESATGPLLSDQQVDALAKGPGAQVFSITGKAPGNNHGEQGGNVLFIDGRVEWSPPRAAFNLPLPPGGLLLNP